MSDSVGVFTFKYYLDIATQCIFSTAQSNYLSVADNFLNQTFD